MGGIAEEALKAAGARRYGLPKRPPADILRKSWQKAQRTKRSTINPNLAGRIPVIIVSAKRPRILEEKTVQTAGTSSFLTIPEFVADTTELRLDNLREGPDHEHERDRKAEG
jgi:hypothetical protein